MSRRRRKQRGGQDSSRSSLVKPLQRNAYSAGCSSAQCQSKADIAASTEKQSSANKAMAGGSGTGKKSLTVPTFSDGGPSPGGIAAGSDANSTSKQGNQTNLDATVAAEGDAAAYKDPPVTASTGQSVKLSGGRRGRRKRTRHRRTRHSRTRHSRTRRKRTRHSRTRRKRTRHRRTRHSRTRHRRTRRKRARGTMTRRIKSFRRRSERRHRR
jgi:hypothetical protein